MRERDEVRAEEPRAAGPPDDEIVERVRAGDVRLFELLMRRHNRRVYRAIRSVLHEEADVEDAMQDAYVAAFEHLGQFSGSSAFSTWIVRIAFNAALMRVRARSRLRLVSSDPQDDAPLADRPPPPDPERSASSREAAAMLEQALDALPERYRTVFVLRDVELLDTAEAAAVLGVNPFVVKARLHRARTALRGHLLRRVGASARDAFDFQAPRCNRVVLGVMARLPRVEPS